MLWQRDSVRQSAAALCTAAGQNLAAIGGGHSLAEAMHLGTVQLFGLIGTLRCHLITPPVNDAQQQPETGGRSG